jgi:hypothetical protein
MNNIEESNSMIASFVGAICENWKGEKRLGDPYLPDAKYYYFDEVEDAYLPPIDDWSIPVEDLQYHSSFDWLIPVIQKINKEDNNFMISIIGRVIIEEFTYAPLYWQHTGLYFDFTIEGVYKAVVETIKLINNE